MKRLFTALIVCIIAVVCSLSFAACGETPQNYDDSSLLAKITELENKITNMQKDLNKVKDLEKELNDTKAKLLLLQGKVDGDPDKVYQLGETVSYSSNGLKLFEITLIDIRDSGDGRTLVEFDFIPFAFYLDNNLGNTIGAQLIDKATNTKVNNTGSISNSANGKKLLGFNTLSPGQKTVLICINSVNMYIPFAMYNGVLLI